MGDVTAQSKAVFNQLLTVDVLRGRHSTGVALINNLGDVKVVKKSVNALDFLDIGCYTKTKTDKVNCMIGHNRFATAGAINNSNAHPFEFDKVVGVHNGTLRQYYNLDSWNKFDVDSECLYSAINDKGIKDSYGKCDGAMALVWFNKEDKTLHFFRNSERPLCYCYSKDNTQLYWASEAWMLRGILGRNGIEHGEVYTTTAEVLYTFKMPVIYATKGVKLEAPKVVKLTKPVPKYNYNTYQYTPPKLGGVVTNIKKGGGKYAGGDKYTKYLNKTLEIVVNDKYNDRFGLPYLDCFVQSDIDINVRVYADYNSVLWKDMLNNRDVCNFKCSTRGLTHLGTETYLRADIRTLVKCSISSPNKLLDHKGSAVSADKHDEITRKGCFWCGDPLIPQDKVTWIKKDEYVCSSCKSDEETLEYIKQNFGDL